MFKNKLVLFIRMLRLPFISASILPFVFGSFINNDNFNFIVFLIGLLCVICMHLGANLINDYADSKSGADWQDKNFYGFFGGSKLIQEGVLSEKFYLKFSLVFLCSAFLSSAGLTLILKDPRPMVFFILICVLGFFYSHGPVKFSYNRLGEFIIFFLFGPAVVMGGYFLQTKIFPDLKSLMLSIPPGLLTCAILFCNEVPDYDCDIKAKKFTLVSVAGIKNAHMIYFILEISAIFIILVNYFLGYLNILSFLALFLIPFIMKSKKILKLQPTVKSQFIEASKITIIIQTFGSIILTLAVI